MAETLQASIWRGGASGEFRCYEVPSSEHQTVLDVVTYIQRRLDPTLSYRFACRVGMCGSCAMAVNGVARWTCRTLVHQVGTEGRIEVAPLRNLPVLKDLVTDMTPFFDKWDKGRGAFEPPSPSRDDFAVVQPAEAGPALSGNDCIGCAVCFASCDVVSWRPDYLGPAALNRAWTLHHDPRDAAGDERLEAVAGDGGCHVCHSQQSCTLRCPVELDPAASIAGLKRATVVKALFGGKA